MGRGISTLKGELLMLERVVFFHDTYKIDKIPPA